MSAAPEPPPPPAYAYPELDYKVLQVTPDGSGWRWTGLAWEMVDAPGTHHDAIRHHEVVLPLIDLAARLDRDGSSDDAALVELRRFPGCTGSALLDAASILDRSDSPRVIRTAELLRRAAHPL